MSRVVCHGVCHVVCGARCIFVELVHWGGRHCFCRLAQITRICFDSDVRAALATGGSAHSVAAAPPYMGAFPCSHPHTFLRDVCCAQALTARSGSGTATTRASGRTPSVVWSPVNCSPNSSRAKCTTHPKSEVREVAV